MRTAYRWLGRYRSGDRRLEDRSSSPRHCPRRLAPEAVVAIESLRRQRHSGPAIARALGMARSTVGLVLRRLGLNRLDRLEPRPVAVRYERQRPGEMLHLDIKTLGRIARPSHRVTGNRRDRQRLGLPLQALCRGAAPRRRPPRPHQALHTAHQWQCRMLHPDLVARMGLCQVLPIIRRPKRRHRAMDRCLQPHKAPFRPRRHQPTPKTEQPSWKRQLGRRSQRG